ncbi:gamma-glutamylcyclotransferase family protein [Phormidium sp. CCY1219]|uniref:gamma-glutamylcyclotransferase family protein n=1 Tax=Phormidium sp. CCY1219 TaxID=2886104 RepID=UPI002D1F76BB|nr:gamma-glutamylcyclotransferase family protein [Phormidium sp. CCY1219]MEB3829123.1 gamma-glutamylcyclotransferase [Phormidium sp. CCY1219]
MTAFDYPPLTAIYEQIHYPDFSQLLEGIEEWNQAATIVTADSLPHHPGKIIVTTRHALGLSWLFSQLKERTIFPELIAPETFYFTLAKAVLNYQYHRLSEAQKCQFKGKEKAAIAAILGDNLAEVALPNSGINVNCAAGDDATPQGLLQSAIAAANHMWLNSAVELFVYGTLMRGECNHFLMEKAQFLATDAIANAELFHLGPYPMFVSGNGVVYGERYRVAIAAIPTLDRLEEHPDYYRRRWATLTSGKRALVYEGFPQYVEGYPRIVGGNWKGRS